MSRSKYSNEFKQQVLKDNIIPKIIDFKKKDYFSNISYDLDDNGEVSNKTYSNSYIWTDFLFFIIRKNAELDCAWRMIESRKQKTKRIKDKIVDMVLDGTAIFVTLTFKNETFGKTDEVKRRRLVQRFLKSSCSRYVANIDYGKTNGREHYHAVCSNDLKLKDWFKYGSIDVEHIYKTDESVIRTSRYINKLTNHALKNRCISTRLIYSRNVV